MILIAYIGLIFLPNLVSNPEKFHPLASLVPFLVSLIGNTILLALLIGDEEKSNYVQKKILHWREELKLDLETSKLLRRFRASKISPQVSNPA